MQGALQQISIADSLQQPQNVQVKNTQVTKRRSKRGPCPQRGVRYIPPGCVDTRGAALRMGMSQSVVRKLERTKQLRSIRPHGPPGSGVPIFYYVVDIDKFMSKQVNIKVQ